jgi:hypothetical protein
VTKQYFKVSAFEILKESKPHRLLTMFTDDREDEGRPLISELKAMISWMLGGMRDQALTRKTFKRGTVTQDSSFHMIIPVSFSSQSLFYCFLQLPLLLTLIEV